MPEDIEPSFADVMNTMIRYGGSFSKCIGQAGLCADSVNRHKIKTTWASDYAQFAAMWKQDRANAIKRQESGCLDP